MNIIVNIYFAFSLHFEAFKIAGNAVVILKGNLVALLCCTEHAPFFAIFHCFKKLQLVGEFLLPMLQYPI